MHRQNDYKVLTSNGVMLIFEAKIQDVIKTKTKSYLSIHFVHAGNSNIYPILRQSGHFDLNQVTQCIHFYHNQSHLFSMNNKLMKGKPLTPPSA